MKTSACIWACFALSCGDPHATIYWPGEYNVAITYTEDWGPLPRTGTTSMAQWRISPSGPGTAILEVYAADQVFFRYYGYITPTDAHFTEALSPCPSDDITGISIRITDAGDQDFLGHGVVKTRLGGCPGVVYQTKAILRGVR